MFDSKPQAWREGKQGLLGGLGCLALVICAVMLFDPVDRIDIYHGDRYSFSSPEHPLKSLITTAFGDGIKSSSAPPDDPHAIRVGSLWCGSVVGGESQSTKCEDPINQRTLWAGLSGAATLILFALAKGLTDSS
jgi:hypothetical protein